MRKLRHSKNEDVTSPAPCATGLVGLLETMRAQLEVFPLFLSCTSIFSQIFCASNMKKKSCIIFMNMLQEFIVSPIQSKRLLTFL